MPSIGFDSCSARIRSRIALVGRLVERRQELVQRRVEQPDRDRQARPSPRRSPRSRPAGSAAACRARARRSSSLGGHDHLAHDREPVLGHEHVLGAAEADPLGAELARLAPRPRACPRSRAPSGGAARRPSSRIVSKSSLICGGTRSTAPTITRPVPPSIVITSPSPSSCPPIVAVFAACVDRERLAAGDARLAHPARDDRRVRGHPAVRGQDPLRGDHPVDVVRASSPSGRG